jgi:hypothetical protein
MQRGRKSGYAPVEMTNLLCNEHFPSNKFVISSTEA